MIVCVSANPAIDRRLLVRDLKIGQVNRAASAVSFAGGKAAHVAMAAKALGEEKVIWIGFLGGSTGDELESQLKSLDIEVFRVHTRSSTRINDEIIGRDGRITEILEPGGKITENELTDLKSACDQIFKANRSNFHAVFSGSLPPSVPRELYSELISIAQAKGGKTILDTSGEPLIQALNARPDLIKPNREEAEKALNMAIDNNDAAALAAKRLVELGAKGIAISLGASGLIWCGRDNEAIVGTPPKVNVNSTVGCGDATVAGLVAATRRGYDHVEMLRLAVACGTANCLAELPGQIKLEDVEKLLPLVKISGSSVSNRTSGEMV